MMFKILAVALLAVGLVNGAGEAAAESASAPAEAAPAAAAQPEQEGEPAEPTDNIIDVAEENGFLLLLTALKAADLTDTLKGDGPFTVFAPTDEAFKALGEDALAELLKPENKEKLAGILKYHVVAGKFGSEDLTDGQVVPTLQGESVTETIDSDGTIMVNDATVDPADVPASNGIVHVIDKVLIPPKPDEEVGTIAEVAAATPELSILVDALTAADLVQTLEGDGPFTVFAPTDEAFVKLLAELGVTLEDLVADTEKLKDILLYHVVSGAVKAADLETGPVMTVQGGNVQVTVKDDGTIILNEGTNDATVVIKDVPASNGVVHVISEVLTPPTRRSLRH